MERTLTSDILSMLRETPPEAPRIQHALQEWTSLCNSLPSTTLISRTAIVQEGIQLKMRAGQEWTVQVAQAYGAFLRSLSQLTEATAHDRSLTTTAASGPQGGSHTTTYASPVQSQGGQHDDIPLARVITPPSPTVGNPVASSPVQQSAASHSQAQAPTLRYLATILFPRQPLRPLKAMAASLSITLMVGGAAIALNFLHPYAGFGLGIAFLIIIMVIRTRAFRTWNWDDRFHHAASLLVGAAVGVLMLSLVSFSSSDDDEEDEEDEDENSGLSWVGQLAQVVLGLVLWAVFAFLYLKRGRQHGFPGPYDDLPPAAPQQPVRRRAEVV